MSLYDLLPSLSGSLPFGIPVSSHGHIHTNFYPKLTSGYSDSNPLWTTASITQVSIYYQHNFSFPLCYNIKIEQCYFFHPYQAIYIISVFSFMIFYLVSSCLWHQDASWTWSYSSWIYNYLCNQSLSPLILYSIQLYVIKFVSGLWQVGSLCRVLWFPPPIKLTATV